MNQQDSQTPGQNRGQNPSQNPRMNAAAIRQARAEHPDLRERDFGRKFNVSEAELVAAFCGRNVRRIAVDPAAILPRLEALGEVMALTRNESAVHEKIGVYDRFIPGKGAMMMLGETIDLRIFPSHWKHGFMVEKGEGGEKRRSLQFFDAQGDAVHKIHLRPASDLAEWTKLVDEIAVEDQSEGVAIAEPKAADAARPRTVPVEALRERWAAMTDTHQFVGILRDLDVERQDAIAHVGEDFAWELAPGSASAMLEAAAAQGGPLMCFVASRGCIQIHSGPVANIKAMGPWINVMDPDFHLHLRTDHIANAWAVRKPTDKGHVTSFEAYDSAGELIIQFFGKRIEGQDERAEWRSIVENLPRLPRDRAA